MIDFSRLQTSDAEDRAVRVKNTVDPSHRYSINSERAN